MWTVLTHKAVLSNQFQGQLVRQHRRVAMGDVGKGPGMDKHWCTLEKNRGAHKCARGVEKRMQSASNSPQKPFTLLNQFERFWVTTEV